MTNDIWEVLKYTTPCSQVTLNRILYVYDMPYRYSILYNNYI